VRGICCAVDKQRRSVAHPVVPRPRDRHRRLRLQGAVHGERRDAVARGVRKRDVPVLRVFLRHRGHAVKPRSAASPCTWTIYAGAPTASKTRSVGCCAPTARPLVQSGGNGGVEGSKSQKLPQSHTVSSVPTTEVFPPIFSRQKSTRSNPPGGISTIQQHVRQLRGVSCPSVLRRWFGFFPDRNRSNISHSTHFPCPPTRSLQGGPSSAINVGSVGAQDHCQE